jgi:hypothetical protein
MLRTTRAGEEVPEHDGGDPWPYAVITHDGSTHFSDTATELLVMAIPGYPADTTDSNDRGDDGVLHSVESDLALIARYDDLVSYADALQQTFVAGAVEDGLLDLSLLDESILTAMLGERMVPYEPHIDGLPTEWPANLPPLVLVATDYEPFTDRPMPTGNLVWVDPSTELTYLQSLNNIGIITLMVAPS